MPRRTTPSGPRGRPLRSSARFLNSTPGTGEGAPELAARIGLDSGSVVVDASGEVFGETPNVAARIQGLAEPGTVVVTANVQRQTAGLFVAEDRGAYELKGVPAPVMLYRIVRASGGRRASARSLIPLVGREEELNLLMRRWERASSGQGQFVQIVGEPGIGKSRLVEEFHARLGETPHTWVEWSSSQLLQNTPLHPIAEWGRQRFGDAETPAGQRLADLENTLKLIGLDPAEHAPLLAPLVDIPLPTEPAAHLAPEELRRLQFAAMTAWVLAGARSQPVALAFEDLQWADPTSLDLMQVFAERGAHAPLLILATTRPDFRPPWSQLSHHSVISLSPLDRADVALMVGELAARHALSREVVEGVIARTGGVPLFVEEVTRLLLERGEQGGLQAIPPTLQQSLAARLDRLGDAREVAQIGAVLGRDFPYTLLHSVSGVGEPALQSALDRLVDADLLILEGAGHQATYRFKHALIQDAAYESLLRSRRQLLHRRVAETLRDHFADAAATETAARWEMLARHFALASLSEEAAYAWHEAGLKAALHGAYREAERDFQLALECLDKLEESSERTLFKLSVETELHTALQVTEGYSAPRTVEATERLKKLSDKIGEVEHSIAQAGGRWASLSSAGRYTEAANLANQFFTLATKDGRPEIIAFAHMIRMTSRFRVGDLVGAERHYLAGKPQFSLEVFTRRPGAVGQLFGNASQAAWMLGHTVEARERMSLAISLTASTNSTYDSAFTNFMAAMLAVLMRDLREAAIFAQHSLDLADRHSYPQFASSARIALGRAQAELHRSNEALDLIDTGIAAMAETGATVGMTLYLAWQAEAQAFAGRFEEALTTVDRAHAFNPEERSFLSELFRIRGELRALIGNHNRAEADMRRALSLAGNMKAPGLGLRAAISLHRYLERTGQGHARDTIRSTPA